MLNTRHIFFEELDKLMSKDKDIIFLTDDLGYSYFETIKEKYPTQFVNCGCTEQSMVGIAVGLFMTGKSPYLYSTVPFILFRALEQVRNDIAQQGVNVKIIGVSMSGFLGYTHNLLHDKEDINVCENIGLKNYAPKTFEELRDIINSTYQSKESCYIRL